LAQVILIDANVLVYAHMQSFEQHDAAQRWVEDRFNSSISIGLPWPALLAFVRVVTNPRLFQRPSPMSEAWGQVTDWLTQDNAWIPAPSERHAEVLGSLVSAARVQGDLIHDAHLAALAIEHGLTLCSADGDFARFPGLRWENPLVTS
jgi:toxin-antitoxin system PIN domain toxin